MSSTPPWTLSRSQENSTALDQDALFKLGLAYAQRISGRIWTDYNIHDPGRTTLELLCYAITDLSYRASWPIEDLLASRPETPVSDEDTAPEDQGIVADQGPLFPTRSVLPCRPWTARDYRKLLIDLQGVRNAWLRPARRSYTARPPSPGSDSTRPLELHFKEADDEAIPGAVEVKLKGLFEAVLDLEEGLSDEERDALKKEARQALQSNRNLCEAIVAVDEVQTQPFRLCCALELAPGADAALIQAHVIAGVERYLAPAVPRRTLEEMLARYPTEVVFEGPPLKHGFIDDRDLDAARRDAIRLSDLMRLIMAIPGVIAIRDISIAPPDQTTHDEVWTLPVAPNTKAVLDRDRSKFSFSQGYLPIVAQPDEIEAHLAALRSTQSIQTDNAQPQFSHGTPREVGTYVSFQAHFPEVYGLKHSVQAGPGREAAARRRLADQLKGYLLFFDQIMADYLAHLEHIRDLFSTHPERTRACFHQVVTSLEAVYIAEGEEEIQETLDALDPEERSFARRDRFLDHLIARFAEGFSRVVAIMRAADNSMGPREVLRYKGRILRNAPRLTRDRGLAPDVTKPHAQNLQHTDSISGLEDRVTHILNMTRTNTPLSQGDREGMYLVENILLRPKPASQQAFFPIDPDCDDCSEYDPYSYRLHILLPAYAGRLTQPPFRRFVEETLRRETPAHIYPKICWLSQQDMADFEEAWRDFHADGAGDETLQALIDVLFRLKSVYPPGKLHDCDPNEGEERPRDSAGDPPEDEADNTTTSNAQPIILGHTALGTMDTEET